MVQYADPGTRTTNSYSNCKTNRDVTNTVASFVLQFNKTNSLILILKKCLPDKFHLILILFLILKKYSFVNQSHIFRITTKERKNMVVFWFVGFGCYIPWLFSGSVYQQQVISWNQVIDPGYFQVAYTLIGILYSCSMVIDPGCFLVAYINAVAIVDLESVIDPGCFLVAYILDQKTSLCNKV